MEALTRQSYTAGLLQQSQALLELQVAQAGKALLGRGLPAAQVHCAVLKAIGALVSASCRIETESASDRPAACKGAGASCNTAWVRILLPAGHI